MAKTRPEKNTRSVHAANQTETDPIADYLWNPMSHGVNYCRLSIDRLALKKFVDGLLERIPKELREETVEEETHPRLIGRSRMLGRWGGAAELISEASSLDDLDDFIRSVIDRLLGLGGRTSERAQILEPLSYMAPVLDWMALVNDIILEAPCLETLKSLARPSDKLSSTRDNMLIFYRFRSKIRSLRRGKRKLFDSDLPLVSSQDAIHIVTHVHPEAFIVELVSVKEEGLNRFLELLSRVPEISAGLHQITKKIQYSSQVVFEPYPAAVSVWIARRSAAEHVPKYILEYLEAAIQYHSAREWRTSIVLSAIALETLLAEMFEEEFHMQAPDVPLGNLKERIEESFKKSDRGPAFPNEILQWIDKTNDMRIAAVHRSSRQLSMRETLDALRGIVKTVLWYYYQRSS